MGNGCGERFITWQTILLIEGFPNTMVRTPVCQAWLPKRESPAQLFGDLEICQRQIVALVRVFFEVEQ